ncbi:hypothetical protein FZEAL_9825 [Fusarium zealandicum]|uniref:Uncharacterized protein n=1 Tax=Fusarium zealandicum TaxID=1053134 RepID=A0A8H4U7Y2_9HYPO|nr:hypothetical protein FZEAL_9825 [Fusarium zealandicum]
MVKLRLKNAKTPQNDNPGAGNHDSSTHHDAEAPDPNAPQTSTAAPLPSLVVPIITLEGVPLSQLDGASEEMPQFQGIMDTHRDIMACHGDAMTIHKAIAAAQRRIMAEHIATMINHEEIMAAHNEAMLAHAKALAAQNMDVQQAIDAESASESSSGQVDLTKTTRSYSDAVKHGSQTSPTLEEPSKEGKESETVEADVVW